MGASTPSWHIRGPIRSERRMVTTDFVHTDNTVMAELCCRSCLPEELISLDRVELTFARNLNRYDAI